ncbi:MAG: hypothetical protein AWM53_01574 [Candidatus Dichloromethanomonas elyunquensis]|nr:MAG: hypothetical protein AWM53_01574 [Candidatus Dichloromethanomonas elyunquensis]
MNLETKRIVLVNSSPKLTEESTSGLLNNLAAKQIKTAGLEIYRINVRQSLFQGKTENDFEAMLDADAMVLTFPLYVFCLPGILMRFLQDYYTFWLKQQDRVKNARVYAIVNCGFPEARINLEAVRVIQCFSRKINSIFRFGVMIGGGGMLQGAKDTPFMRKTFSQLENAFQLTMDDILNCGQAVMDNIMITMNFPKKLYFFMGNRGWYSTAKKNGLKRKDLYRKPYFQENVNL